MQSFRIESLLSARQFVQPQLAGDRLYFISNLSGRLSLFVMNVGGSVPEPLVLPGLALPNPHHLEHTVAYRVLPDLGKILLMLDSQGDENYQPVFLPLAGGIPAPVFGSRFAGQQVLCAACDPATNLALLAVDPRHDPLQRTFLADLATGELTEIAASLYGAMPVAHSPDFATVVLMDQYTFGDAVYYLWRRGEGERRLLFGTPLDQRATGEPVPPNGIGWAHLVQNGPADGPATHAETGAETNAPDGLLFISALYADGYGLTWLPLADPAAVQPVPVHGLAHTGQGELTDLKHGRGNLYILTYNIDGADWVYEGAFDRAARRCDVRRVLAGQGELAGGVLESLAYDAAGDRYALSFSTATSPSQLYLVARPAGAQAGEQAGGESSGQGAGQAGLPGRVCRQTNERLLGIAPQLLAAGEDASYTAHDGLRISARLYLPAPDLGYTDPRPVIFYVHGGPQSQERPDFTWFSMPLIQFFTLNGFAVWVPNVRGSSGYGIDYMKRVDNDWGGCDRLDHVAACDLLAADPRLDLTRAGVMGRSYGGYMTLTLAGRHPARWRAAVDMFGPYNLLTFIDRLPEAWKTYFHQAVGHPERDRDFLVERSPSTYLHNLACPLLVIQGANDPRVVERESRDVVETLQAQGKDVQYVVYPDEGHDVLTFANRVDCYTRITEFFKQHLRP